jgi:hypothetical protein
MRLSIVCNLITHTGPKREDATVFEFGVEFATNAKQYMALITPVIGFVPGRILNHSDANITKLLGAPQCRSALTFVFRALHLRPIGRTEGD